MMPEHADASGNEKTEVEHREANRKSVKVEAEDEHDLGVPRKIESSADAEKGVEEDLKTKDHGAAGPGFAKLSTDGNEEKINTGKERVGLAKSKDSAETKDESSSDDDDFKDAETTLAPEAVKPQQSSANPDITVTNIRDEKKTKDEEPLQKESEPTAAKDDTATTAEPAKGNRHKHSRSAENRASEWSHQAGFSMPAEKDDMSESEDEWQTMPAFAPFDMYDDDNKLIAREAHESDEEAAGYEGLGGAAKGYTRVQLDEDAQSATSLDEHTSYLFKEAAGTNATFDDDEQRDAVSQMQATKDLLTEGQRIAYVGMTRLVLSDMIKFMEGMENLTKGSKKVTVMAAEGMKMWSQKMMLRLYAHMEITSPEQVMIEQLAEHGVQPGDLTPTLMANARVKNPMAENAESTASLNSPRPSSVTASPRDSMSKLFEEETASPPPAYEEGEGDYLPEVRTPSQLPTTKNIDIDLRWTVLCDLFLTLVADSIYDARSRTLLEKVGSHMDVSWLDICRFEKRVTDALEMQQAAEKENWNEEEHKENRRKMALKKRYMMMGLATVGGGLVIGLSAGLLAPVIGAGLAAGFTTIGVAGTSGFLAGAGGAAIITSTAAASGGIIAVRAANRRTGAVKTFEYRPLHNNKRVNLIVTVSGWMTGKVDDVRLPYSTIDPIMGDIYSVLWEPEMLTSMGDTINILATEALTQGLQQVLGSTILIGLMAALQLPVVLTKLSYLIDNPWTVSLDRANSAGLILADSLIDRNLGTRPITFVGYSLGSRVIFSCLRELARKGALGLVQNVYLFGSPIVANRDDYLRARSVVSGRFVNGYARNDWILGYLFRLTSGGISRIAGLAPVNEIPGLENVDVTDIVPGHMAYRTAMPRLLREVGWLVESDEFTEIEDPDPDNHAQRQRELINEIEEARKEFDRQEREAKGGTFAFLRRKKKKATDKKEWETYQESKDDEYGEPVSSKNDSVLFDIDAIRAELASEHMEVKELKSTLPPMKLDLSPTANSNKPVVSPRLGELRETKSSDAIPPPYSYPRSYSPSYSHSRNSESRNNINNPYLSPDPNHYDEEVQMSFDTAYSSPARSPAISSNALGRHVEEPEMESERPPVPPKEEFRNEMQGIERPELKRASYTVPAMEHNAWADDEDEFKEQEMEMTFA